MAVLGDVDEFVVDAVGDDGLARGGVAQYGHAAHGEAGPGHEARGDGRFVPAHQVGGRGLQRVGDGAEHGGIDLRDVAVFIAVDGGGGLADALGELLGADAKLFAAQLHSRAEIHRHHLTG